MRYAVSVVCLGAIGFSLVSYAINNDDFLQSLPRVKDSQGFLSKEFLQALAISANYSVFIETGTYLGESAARASNIFEEVHTIELDRNLYVRATTACRDISNLHIYHGHSPFLIPQIILMVSDKKIIFWLDAHYSGQGTARGDSNTPILAELSAIKESGVQNAIIMIDDMRIFAEAGSVTTDITHQGYPAIERLVEALKLINPSYSVYLFDDIAIAIPPYLFDEA